MMTRRINEATRGGLASLSALAASLGSSAGLHAAPTLKAKARGPDTLAGQTQESEEGGEAERQGQPRQGAVARDLAACGRPVPFATSPAGLVELAMAGAAASAAAAALSEAKAEAEAISQALDDAKAGGGAPDVGTAPRAGEVLGAAAAAAATSKGASDRRKVAAKSQVEAPSRQQPIVQEPAVEHRLTPTAAANPQRRVVRARDGAASQKHQRSIIPARPSANRDEGGAEAGAGRGGGESSKSDGDQAAAGTTASHAAELVPEDEPRRKRLRLVFNQDDSAQRVQ